MAVSTLFATTASRETLNLNTFNTSNKFEPR